MEIFTLVGKIVSSPRVEPGTQSHLSPIWQCEKINNAWLLQSTQGSQPPWPNGAERKTLIQSFKGTCCCGSITSYRHEFCSTPDTCSEPPPHVSVVYGWSPWIVFPYTCQGKMRYCMADTVCPRGTFFNVKWGAVFCFSFVMSMLLVPRNSGFWKEVID